MCIRDRVKPCTQYNPISNTIKNKKTIEREFLNICKRCEMTINKQDELLEMCIRDRIMGN